MASWIALYSPRCSRAVDEVTDQVTTRTEGNELNSSADPILRRYYGMMKIEERVKTNVLVVDDDAGICDMLSTVLEDEGYAVETAVDGLEGLAEARRARPDVVLLDFTMPRCDGEAFAERYRAFPDPAPIILLTASHQVRERCRLVHADGCIGKPFDIDELLAAVETQTHAHPTMAQPLAS
jgi:CheY-like chemotaxis protein